MDFGIDVYKEAQRFPAHEKFRIAGQLQRAAVSIPSNIAEGAEK
jgi:four helix bundle protein